MRGCVATEYKEQLAVAEKLYEVQAPLRAAQAEEEARLQKLEAEEEQRKHPCHVTVSLGSVLVRLGGGLQSMTMESMSTGCFRIRRIGQD